MKKYLITFLFVLVTTLSFGQNSSEDVVYLKNGSIIRGIIIEQVPNKTIKLETKDRSVFVYQMDEIEKITKESYQERQEEKVFNNKGLQVGYKRLIELGYEAGVGDYGMDRLKVNVINGYQISPYFSLGLGTGMRYYFEAEAVLVPVFLDFRVNFINNKVSPYLSLGGGYSFDATNNFEGVGLLINPTVGVSFKVSEKSVMNVGLGHEMQMMKFFDYYYDTFTEISEALSINIGISF